MKRIALVLLLTPCIYAQDAHVIQLTPAETKQAVALYAEQKEVAAKIDALKAEITKAHLPHLDVWHWYTNPTTYAEVINNDNPDTTWWSGFTFSTDFKFIVPLGLPRLPAWNGCYGCIIPYNYTQPYDGGNPSSSDEELGKPLRQKGYTVLPATTRSR